jgi:hypothetical protein
VLLCERKLETILARYGNFILKERRKGREGKGREGKGREGKGREGKGREGKGGMVSGTQSFFMYYYGGYNPLCICQNPQIAQLPRESSCEWRGR